MTQTRQRVQGAGSEEPREESPTAARTKSKVTPKYKTKYRVKNWAEYEACLRKRGDAAVWFEEDAARA